MCLLKGITSQVSFSIKAGELQPSLKFPPHHHLVNDCKMKPSLDHHYQVSIISLDDAIVFIVKNYKQYFLKVEDLYNLSKVNWLYGNMVNNFLHLRLLDFLEIKKPRFDYAECWVFHPSESTWFQPAAYITGSTQACWSATSTANMSAKAEMRGKFYKRYPPTQVGRTQPTSNGSSRKDALLILISRKSLKTN